MLMNTYLISVHLQVFIVVKYYYHELYFFVPSFLFFLWCNFSEIIREQC